MTSYVFGGGCFWCIDAIFRRIKGVSQVESGYAGGSSDAPTYYQVATGRSGHAEVVRITFDEAVIPADTILDIFFTIHDPTTLNRQGPDEGTQYRSIMLFSDDGQKQTFERALKRAQVIWDDPIVTEIAPLKTFYVAEEEHQDYFHKNPEAGYCSIVIAPKIVAARTQHKKWFKEDSL